MSGLKIFDVMTYNWDAQSKNCEVLKVKADTGDIDWYIVSDMGRGFGNHVTQWNLSDYQKDAFISSVDDNIVTFDFIDADKKENEPHRKIPIADVQWFRSIVDKLSDDDIRAAFNAAVATPELTAAYASGDITKANSLTSPEVNGFVAEFRRRINELDTKVPKSP